MLWLVILNFTSSLRTIFILYLLPFTIYVIIVELYYICDRSPPNILANRPQSLRRRAFDYQIASALAIGFTTRYWRDPGGDVVLGIAITVLVMGVFLFILAQVAHECGFADWVEPEPGGGIRLDDPEDTSGVLETPR